MCGCVVDEVFRRASVSCAGDCMYHAGTGDRPVVTDGGQLAVVRPTCATWRITGLHGRHSPNAGLLESRHGPFERVLWLQWCSGASHGRRRRATSPPTVASRSRVRAAALTRADQTPRELVNIVQDGSWLNASSRSCALPETTLVTCTLVRGRGFYTFCDGEAGASHGDPTSQSEVGSRASGRNPIW